jgi:gliding motility-associated-like protein
MKFYFFFLLCVFGFFSIEANAQCGGDTTSTLAISEVIMPSVFTPNFDGQNDGFNITGGCITAVDKKIYNRHGALLFDSNLINEVWNGRTTAGKEVSEGTYFYIFQVEMLVDGVATSKTFKGSLSLLR